MGRLLALAAALLGGALIAWATQQPPRVAAADAPAIEFSAARAMADVEAIGRVPHPTGSAAQLKARDYLLQRLRALGLAPQVWRGEALEREPGAEPLLSGAAAYDLIGVLPGRDRAAPALLLMAHYDSVAGSPGAADDAAGVASAVETVRAIKARGVPARDVVVLLTDGEEVGLIGARAFFARHPLARHIGFVLNLEARGSAGRTQMFQTGVGGGQTIGLFQRTAQRPSAQALSGYVYERMPNDTDFTVARNAGLAGLNYAFLGGQFDYHSPSSTPSTLDEGTLQDMGGQALAAAAAAAFGKALPAKSPDVVYGSVFGDLLIAYPPWAGWLVLAGAGLLLALAVRRASRIAPLPGWDAARGAGAALYAVACAIAVLEAARRATGASLGFLEQRPLLAQSGRWEAACLLLALGVLLFSAAELARGRRRAAVLLPLGAAAAGALLVRGFEPLAVPAGLAAATLAFASFGRPVSRPATWAGVLALGLVLGVALQAFAPQIAYVVAWPLAAGAVAAAATALGARRSYPALAVIAAIALGWVGGLAHGAFVSLDAPPLLAAPLLLAAFALWPLAQPGEGAPPARRLGGLLLVAGLVVLAVVRFASPYSPRSPLATDVVYLLDQDAGRAWRIDLMPGEPDAWTRAALTGDGGKIERLRHWLIPRPVEAAAARPVALPQPVITLTRRPDGALVLHAQPLPGGRIFTVRLSPDTPVTLAAVNGVAANIRMQPGGWTHVSCEGAAEGLDLVLAPAGPGRVQVRYVDTLERWPAGVQPLPSRPAAVMAFGGSDATLVAGSRAFAW